MLKAFITSILISFIPTTASFAIDPIKKDPTPDAGPSCSEQIRKLEIEIAILKDRLNRKENCPSSQPLITSPGDTWICKYQGFQFKEYVGTGGSKAVAQQVALEKCKADPQTHNGFYCSLVSCTQ